MMDKTRIKPYAEIHRQIYGYILPGVPSHQGYMKVGDTTRGTETRVFEQVSAAGLTPEIIFERTARRSDGKWFKDHDLHRFFELNGIKKAKLGRATEWYFFNDELEKAAELTDKYINRDYDEVQKGDDVSDYILREEQNKAVELTVDYFNSGKEPREFLWNAKPRFGKTLTSYDFIRRIKATNVLIVTNRPAIANSWFDDFQKFIAWQEPGMKFISDTDALKGKAMSREDFFEFIDTTKHESPSQITFLSLQDLKGARAFGGHYDKLEWVADLKWDLLIIDEAHEGIDTELTDAAFDEIQRSFTLHLSGTPFKALASNKFNEEQIFNWSYVDEQEAKLNWDYSEGSNPYEDMPQLSLFTYQMSKMIEEQVEKGVAIGDDENVDYAFDLNEFFRADERGKFKYEASVKKFLDNLCSGHFPFSEGRHRDELQHTFWLLPRVNSAKALEALLKEHPVFKDYTVVLAAGDGISVDYDLAEEATDFKKNEKSFNKVREAIRNNEKTITLSVGQLTTGVTIPEWSAVLMLSNIKSPSFYFQAAFRSQNPYEFIVEDKLYRKENAYIFDFAPDRTLTLYDEFANNLSGEEVGTVGERKRRIKTLLNFFPVIGEDEEGRMHELDATEVLIIPTRITSKEVVKRGFMSNLLFANISGIFTGHAQFKEILEKIRPEKNRRLMPRREIDVTDPMLDDRGNVAIPREIVVNKTDDIFGPRIYKVIETIDPAVTPSGSMVKEINRKFDDGFKKIKEEFHLTNVQVNEVKKEVAVDVEEAVKTNLKEHQKGMQAAAEFFQEKIKVEETAGNEEAVAELEKQFTKKKRELDQNFTENLSADVSTVIEGAVEEQIIKVEAEKKKTTEDDVRDHLRGFARTIPAFLMAYGDAETTLANYDEKMDEPTFKELTGITVAEFRKLRDGFEFIDDDGNNKKVPGLFNEVVFNASVKEFFATKDRLSNYFDETQTEDIFDYIPPQKTNQIFTPRKVVNRMLDLLEKTAPGIFSDYNTKFLDLYAKSGLYIAEIVRRLNVGLKEQIPNSKERIKWILENQVYAIAPSNIIYNIVKNFVYPNDTEASTKNLVELDLTNYTDDENWQNIITQAFGGVDLKFDVIIGNPPYQEMDGGARASASPLYHKFVEMAMDLNPRLISFIIPARWFSGGKGLSNFRRKMLNDIRIRELHDYFDATDCFPGIDISGGVCYFVWDKDYKGDCNVTSYRAGKINSMKRPLLREGNDTFIRFNEAISILDKVHSNDFESFAKKVSPRKPFGLPTNVKVQKGQNPGDVKIYAYPNDGYYPLKKVERNLEWIDKWKVLVAKAYGERGEFPYRVIAEPFIAEKGACCSESYLVVRLCDTEREASNVKTYMRTRLFRFLVLLKKNTQDATSKVYSLVPAQDFTEAWTDEKLYAKYGLTKEEISFIESLVRPMELG